MCKKNYIWNSNTCICVVRIKNIGDTSVIECDEIITVMGIVSTKMTNALARSIKGTDSINCHSKKK